MSIARFWAARSSRTTATTRLTCSALTLAEGQETPHAGIAGDVLELALEASVPATGVFGLKVRLAPDGSEQTIIRADFRKRVLSVDTTRSSLSPHVYQRHPIANPYGKLEAQQDIRVQEAPFELAAGEPLRLRVFLDKSILDVYANRRQCVTQRIYPTWPDNLGVAVFCRGGHHPSQKSLARFQGNPGFYAARAVNSLTIA